MNLIYSNCCIYFDINFNKKSLNTTNINIDNNTDLNTIKTVTKTENFLYL